MLIEKQGKCILLDLIQEIILNCDLKIELSSYLGNSTYSVEFQQFYKFKQFYKFRTIGISFRLIYKHSDIPSTYCYL